MKIVILDAYTANPGDLSWDGLSELGELKVYERTPQDMVKDRCLGAQIVFTNKTVLDGEILQSLPDMKFIGVLATGYNVVDIATAKKLGITVCNVPSYSTYSVAQNVFALLLDITNSVAHYSNGVHGGKWANSEDFCYYDTNLIELAGKKIGIVGYGNIGRKVGEIAIAFGMQPCAYTSKSESEIAPAVKMDLDTLFRECDVISLHCPLTPQTLNLVDKSRLEIMKPSSILINTGRGPLVDEMALAEALKNGIIAGAGLDVLSKEPPEGSNPLLGLKNCRITPHISWATREARQRLISISVENLRAFIAGKPINVVN